MNGALGKKKPAGHYTGKFIEGMALPGVLWAAAILATLSVLLLASIERSAHSALAGTREQNRQLALSLAHSLLERDLLAEVRAGSEMDEANTTEPPLVPLTYPKTAGNAVPYRTPNLPPNLLRQSRRPKDQLEAATVADDDNSHLVTVASGQNRPAMAVSTETPALNFPGISAARWNAPALLPLASPQSPHDRTPARSGTCRVGGKTTQWTWSAPDWIVLRRDGSVGTKWSDLLRAGGADLAGAESASIRWAYQIYDCGGLIDLSHAGYDPTVLPQEDAARKGAPAFADLTQIGLDADATRTLVRWRNETSSNLPDGPPYHNRVLNLLLGPTRGPYWFGNAAGPHPSLAGRRFASRRQLLQFLESIPTKPGAFSPVLAGEYATHFSRALEQPSFRPGAWDQPQLRHKVPRIVCPAAGTEDKLHPIRVASLLPAGDLRIQMNLPYEMALGNYRGGNDAWGTFAQRRDAASGQSAVQDAINPRIQEVRVTVPFIRRDGTPAEIGEPLVKTRFPLSRLAWLTHRGPSATLSPGDPLYNAQGTPEAIKACFGLQWTRDNGRNYHPGDGPGTPEDQSGSFFWMYDHRSAGGNIQPESIARLSQVADAGREPDFFELLKAGILVGSIGKASAKNHAGMEGWPHDPATFAQLRDKNPTHQILQIGANIIDQSDPDSFPTVVKIGARQYVPPGGDCFVPTFTARGVENLPYLYRLHWRAVPNLNDQPKPRHDKIVEITSGFSAFFDDGFHCGTTSLIAFPELWNPHLPPRRPSHNTLKLRMLAVAEDPEGPAGPENQFRPLFPLLGTRWKTLMLSGERDDQHAHFSSWPGGAFAFSINTPGKSTKVFFHDRRFSSSYEFFGTSAGANDHHSGRLSTNNPAEPSSYLFWGAMPQGNNLTKYAVEGFAFWRLSSADFAPIPPAVHPTNPIPPSFWRGHSYSLRSVANKDGSRPVWFAPADGRVNGQTLVEGPPSPDPNAPSTPVLELRNSEITFQLPLLQTHLFREPTSLCRRGLPQGTGADFGGSNFFHSTPYLGALLGADGESWLGFSLGEVPSQFIAAQRLVSAPKTTLQGTPEKVDSSGAPSTTGTLWRFFVVPVNLVVQRNWCLMTLHLQYQDPSTSKWITYDEKFAGMDGRMVPDQPPFQGQWNAVPVEGTSPSQAWASPALCWADPRTPRFGAFQCYAYNWSNAVHPEGNAPPKALPLPPSPTGAGLSDRPTHSGTSKSVTATGGGPALYNLGWTRFKAAIEQDPAILTSQYEKATAWWAVRSLVQPPSLNANDYGWISRLGNPASASSTGITGARGFSHFWEDYSHDAGAQESTETGRWQYWADCFRPGWLSENIAPSPAAPERQAYADPDDVIRRAAGGRAPDNGYSSNLDGLPLAQQSGSPNRSRPVILDRAFRSVAELGYVFRGAPWKQLDFSFPETADAALLDLFCLSEPPVGLRPLGSGKINLNSRQEPVLRALLSGALRDELDPATQIRAAKEIANTAQAILDHTSGTGLGRGPLSNLSELAGRTLGKNLQLPGINSIPNAFTAITTAPTGDSATLYTSVAPHTVTAPERNPDTSPGQPVTWTFSGLSADLDSAFADVADRKIPRLRETALRALVDSGQVRVWNLLLDVIVQTGRYPYSAVSASEFLVETESRAWVHLAIDRYTGEVLDRQVEMVEP
jgi:hypothetical protein